MNVINNTEKYKLYDMDMLIIQIKLLCVIIHKNYQTHYAFINYCVCMYDVCMVVCMPQCMCRSQHKTSGVRWTLLWVVQIGLRLSGLCGDHFYHPGHLENLKLLYCLVVYHINTQKYYISIKKIYQKLTKQLKP